MIRFSIHLPTKYRIDINLVKNRSNLEEKPILPSLGEILRVRNGNKISRFFRHIFEHKRTKKLFGSNIALAIFTFSLVQSQNLSRVSDIEVNTTQNVTVSTEKGVQYPTSYVSITQKYSFYHPGIDFDGITGDTIKPILRGKVVAIENSRFAYGKSIVIDHGNGISSRYAHLSKIDVELAQDVTKDTKIGEMGSTGRSFGDHLHLEVYDNGKTINPLSLLSN